MHARQEADLGHDRAHGLQVATVDARLAVDDALAHDLLLELAERRTDLLGRRFAGQCRDRGITQFADTVVARLLLGDAVSLADLVGELLAQLVGQRNVPGSRRHLPARFAGIRSEFLDGLDHDLRSRANSTAPSIWSSLSS